MSSEDRPVFTFLPLTVSLQTLGGIATPLLLRGTPLPARRTQVFTTAVDNQKVLTLVFTIGERPLTKYNQTLGRADLDGISPARRGVPQLTVNVEIDRTCVLRANAVEATSGKRLDVSLDQSDVLLDQNKIQEHLQLAESNRDSDQRELKSLELRNRASSLLADAETRLSTSSDKALEQLVAKVGIAIQSNDDSAIEQGTEALRKSLKSASTDTIEGLFGDLFKTTQLSRRAGAAPPKPASNAKSSAMRTNLPQGEDELAGLSGQQGVELGKIFGGGSYTLDPTLCFVLMPFVERLRGVFDDHIKPVVEGESLVCIRADDLVGTGQITRDIWERIRRARFLIADLTGRNANVFYELGLAHAIGKSVILLTQSMDDVPFDLKPLRCLVYEYTPPGMRNLEQTLRRTIREVMNSGS